VGPCYRRSHVVLAQCEHVSTHDNYARLANGSWAHHPHINCFAGHGAENVMPEPFARELGLQACQAACEKDDICEAIVVPPSSGGGGSGKTVTVRTDPGFLDPDVYCARYCHWSESEHEITPRLWQNSTRQFSSDKVCTLVIPAALKRSVLCSCDNCPAYVVPSCAYQSR
jgi:hypothetical protein